MSLAKQSYQLQEKPGKETFIRFQASWVYPPKPSPAINVPHSGFSTSHYSCYSQKSTTPCLIRSADEETLLCVFAKCLYSSCPWISKSFRQLLNQSIINPVLVGRALQVLRELSWYPWVWTERNPPSEEKKQIQRLLLGSWESRIYFGSNSMRNLFMRLWGGIEVMCYKPK